MIDYADTAEFHMGDKFGHEKLNRQEKVWTEPTHAAGGNIDRNFFRTFDGLDFKTTAAGARLRLIEREMDFLRKAVLLVQGYRFSFRFNHKDFCRENGLDAETAKGIFKSVSLEAEDSIQFVLRRLRRTPVQISVTYEPHSLRRTETFSWDPSEAISTFLTFAPVQKRKRR